MTLKTFDVKIKIMLLIKNLNINKSKKISNKFTKFFFDHKKNRKINISFEIIISMTNSFCVSYIFIEKKS